jgi:hypothetical protein
MKSSLSDLAVQRLASLKLGMDIPEDDFEDEPEEDPAKKAAEAEDDAQFLYERISHTLSEWMARRGYEAALPLLHDMIVKDPQKLWDTAAAEAYLYEED